MAQAAVCHMPLLRPAGLNPANQKPCPSVDTETEAKLYFQLPIHSETLKKNHVLPVPTPDLSGASICTIILG